ncbi:asparagine synthase-related protein [Paraburkholderia phenazinium]|jgi:asparagine synthase (glutamine-hydrolysing)|nr:asparagine synthase-related protein [Paraburkholderia phenazinium]
MEGRLPEISCDSTFQWSLAGHIIARFYQTQPQNEAWWPRIGENESELWFISGRLYRSGNFSAVDDKEIVEAVVDDLNGFANRFWGTYFLMVYNKKADCLLVVSEPCGQVPVFYRIGRLGELHVGTSAGAFSKIGGFLQHPNSGYLRSYLCHGSGDPVETGIEGLLHLPAGRALSWDRGHLPTQRRFWFPNLQDYANSVVRDPIEVLSSVLYLALGDEVSIMLELSDGLESSSLAIGLQHSGRNDRTVAVTHFDPYYASSNELNVARSVAKQCGIAHRSCPLLDALPFAPCQTLPVVPQPSPQLCFLAQMRSMADSLGEDALSVVINGHGADALFLAPSPLGASVDALAHLRVLRAASALRDLAILYGWPLTSTLRKAMGALGQSHGGTFAQPFCTDALRFEPGPRPAGACDDLIAGRDLRFKPAKRYQLAVLAATLDETVVDARLLTGRLFLPFLSQPLVELVLSMPPHSLFSAFHNRLSVRQSAYHASALHNLWRRDVGDTTQAALKGIAVHQDHVRATCLNGWCVSEGVIERNGLEKLINRAVLGHAAGLVEIARVFAAEMFLSGLPRGR